MMKSKKGDGLPMNVIVMAVLALVVLVTLILIYGRWSSPFAHAYSKCDSPELNGKVETCTPGANCACQEPDTIYPPLTKYEKGEVESICCVKTTK